MRTLDAKHIDRVVVQWNDETEAWTWAIKTDLGLEQVGEYTYQLPRQPCNELLREAVAAVAFDHGLKVSPADVIADSRDSGGWAEWRRPEIASLL